LLNEFKINKVDKCVYVKNTYKGYVIVCLFIDDMLILGNNDHIIKSTKKILTNKFDMKNLGVADIILGIQISRTYDELLLSQSHYIGKILDRISKGNNNTVKTPIDISLYLSNNRGRRINQLEYY
jgi:hypothetical protein